MFLFGLFLLVVGIFIGFAYPEEEGAFLLPFLLGIGVLMACLLPIGVFFESRRLMKNMSEDEQKEFVKDMLEETNFIG